MVRSADSEIQLTSSNLSPATCYLPDPGIKPGSPALRVDSLPVEPPGKSIPNKMRYYLCITTNKIFIPNTTGMDLTNIMLSKRSNVRETTYYVIPFT